MLQNNYGARTRIFEYILAHNKDALEKLDLSGSAHRPAVATINRWVQDCVNASFDAAVADLPKKPIYESTTSFFLPHSFDDKYITGILTEKSDQHGVKAPRLTRLSRADFALKFAKSKTVSTPDQLHQHLMDRKEKELAKFRETSRHAIHAEPGK